MYLEQRNTQYDCFPSEDDRKIAAELCARLENFNNVIEILSSIKYIIVDLFFIEVAEIKLSLIDWK